MFSDWIYLQRDLSEGLQTCFLKASSLVILFPSIHTKQSPSLRTGLHWVT